MSEKTKSFFKSPIFRKTLISVIAVVLLLGAGIGGQKWLSSMRKKPEQKKIPEAIAAVEVLEARKETVTFFVDSQGTVEPRTTTVLFPEVSGVISEVSPDFYEGGMFEKGEMLLQIDPSDYKAAQAEAAARLAEAQLALEEEKARAERALAEWRRLGNTGEPNPLAVREPQVRRAEAAVESARAAVEKARRDIERTTIRGPYQGIVQEKVADVGQYVSPGTRLGTLFAIDKAEVRLPVTKQDFAYLEVPVIGQDQTQDRTPPVEFEATIGGKTHSWQGEVVRTEGAFDPQSRMLSLIAEVDDPYNTRSNTGNALPMGIGMFVEAKVQGITRPGLIKLPRRALRNNREVLVVTPENRIAIRPVEIARIAKRTVYVSDGIEEGERIVVTPMDFVVEDMPVTPLQGEPGEREIPQEGAVKLEETGGERKS